MIEEIKHENKTTQQLDTKLQIQLKFTDLGRYLPRIGGKQIDRRELRNPDPWIKKMLQEFSIPGIGVVHLININNGRGLYKLKQQIILPNSSELNSLINIDIETNNWPASLKIL